MLELKGLSSIWLMGNILEKQIGFKPMKAINWLGKLKAVGQKGY